MGRPTLSVQTVPQLSESEFANEGLSIQEWRVLLLWRL